MHLIGHIAIVPEEDGLLLLIILLKLNLPPPPSTFLSHNRCRMPCKQCSLSQHDVWLHDNLFWFGRKSLAN